MLATPVPTQKHKSDANASPKQILECQQKVWSALFATIISQPDAVRAVSKFSEYNLNSSIKHMDIINQVIQYLYGTHYYAIKYEPTQQSKQFIDASNATFGDNNDRKSSVAFVIKPFSEPID